ncbi:10636_t:CDS:2, partial [Funneliformis caledonium]
LMPFIQGHNVWIQNRAASGTYTDAGATEHNQKGHWSWGSHAIDQQGASAHKGYHLYIPENYTTFWLVFGVASSTEDDKWRGPINNDGDKCWHFHGTEDAWDVYECPN